ncbi:single-stranded-DNA-specific exonuclease RecJ [Alkalicoccus halolimnae]|uniref:Single-stranded-DNA-specific exonuclease RecJ n=1 Tax=Alkalicoccus halolimnae TaxID=1667239 RepID=A0A5C7FK49_9BACI|nr:single-stranded-DNA-specific exonuclease RecJ [Alkalicoccus halolimnae]TXF86509.1 single-stranded-DNA-specific exonuclease RecJ [Alkalicoccus halolimnae]
MLHANSEWIISGTEAAAVDKLRKSTGLSALASKFLVQRKITEESEINKFLRADEKELHDPLLMKDMEKAAVRIHKAINQKENILVFGDYDADGVTSTSLLYSVLTEMGAQAGFYVPNRFTEGYGPNEAAFRYAAEEGVHLIVTVDTGISAVHEAEVAKELGIDLIITDHHEPPPQLPDAYAVINPKQENCSYPFKELAGVGVAFKLSHALTGKIPTGFYDLAAVGTIADLVPLQGENRILAVHGLKALRKDLRPGLKALLEKAGADQADIDEETVGFLIGPRLNAAGRLDSADPAVALLMSRDPEEAEELALMVDDLNKERQSIVKEITAEAEELVEAQGIPPVLVVAKEGWNPGVIGIVASRLVEKYYRPAIVLSLIPEENKAKGSARSIAGFDMFQSLSTMREILPHFGGHPMAAGLTMADTDVENLRDRLISLAERNISEEDWKRKLYVDLPVKVEEISVKTIQDLSQMAPFGIGNPAPKVMLEKTTVEQAKKIGAGQDHLKLTLTDESHSNALDAIAFRMGAKHDLISPLAKLSAVGKLSINEWNGNVKPQLIVEDMKVEEWQLFDFRGNKRYGSKESGERTILIFQESTGEPSLPSSWPVLRVDRESMESADLTNVNHAVLYDVPDTMEHLEFVMKKLNSTERIDAVFVHSEDYFFTSLPSRDQFKWFYGFMQKRKMFDMNKHLTDLAKHKGWSENTVKFICTVFFELGFVKINDGIVVLVEEPGKKELTDSPAYQKHVQKSRIQQELCYSTFRSLKKQLDAMRKTAETATIQSS